MTRALFFFVAGLLIDEIDPIGWAGWQALERQLPQVKQQSLASRSPFERMPPTVWRAESEHAYVVEDHYAPTAPVHLLVIPKERFPSISEAPPELLRETLDLARSASRQYGIAESGFRIIINTNPHCGQTVYHLHMHVKGGQQLREPLLPYIWDRLIQLWHAA